LRNNKDFGLNIITEVLEAKNDEEDDNDDTSTKIHADIYTDNAIILQSILECSKKIGTESFTDESITEYLVKPDESRCKVFEDMYSGYNEKTNIGSRITKNLPTVNELLMKLEYLELIAPVQCTSKTNVQPKQYQFTKLGKIIGLLLLYEQGKINDNKELFNPLIDFYSPIDNSWSAFYIIFLKKCINIPKVFERAILFHIESLKNADSNKDVSIEQLTKVPIILNEEYWQVFNESLNELKKKSPDKYNLLLYALLLLVEEEQESNCANFKGFEKARSTIRCFTDHVTVEGYCNLCKHYSHIGVNVMDYLNSYIYSDPDNRHKHLNMICPACKSGPLYFETIKVRTISGNPILDKKNSRKKFKLLISEDNVKIHQTIFNDSNRSKRYQAILRFLLNKSSEFFTTTDLMNHLLEREPEIFGVNKETKSKPSNNYYYQFESYLGTLATCGLVVSKKIQNSKNKSSMVDAYQLSNTAGKTFALLSKWQSSGNNKKLYDEIYQCWRSSFDDPPISSLDLFCKKYLYKCKKQRFFDVFIQSYNKYLNNNYDIYNNVGIFTKVILSKFDDSNKENKENVLKNEKLWTLWLETYLKLDKDSEDLLLTHLQIHLTRKIEKRIHDLGKYEIERYRHKNESNQLTIEATCLNCTGEYIYMTVPVFVYVLISLNDNSDKTKNLFSEQIKCIKCQRHDFDFIRV